MTNFTLTQFLYQKKDVELMIMYTLLQHNDYSEFLFWISEYIHSGYSNEIWNLIDTLYFDFYILQNPKFYKYIQKKKNLYNTQPKTEYVLDVCKNLYYMKHSPYLFEFRLCFQHEGFTKKSIRGRKPGWITHFKDENRELIFNISKLHCDNVVLLYNSCNDYKSLYHDLCLFVKDYSKYTPTRNTTFIEHIIELFSGCMREEIYKHLCMVFIYNLSIIPPTTIDVDKKGLFIKSSDKDRLLFKSYHKKQTKKKYNWKFIREACVYGIVPLVHVFNHSRKDDEYWKQIWYNWEYYAYSCPLWKKRFDAHHGILKCSKKAIEFKDDHMQETFYDSFGLEPDEQDKATQDKFIIEYDSLPISNLFEKIWNYTPQVLNDSYMYDY